MQGGEDGVIENDVEICPYYQSDVIHWSAVQCNETHCVRVG